MATVTVTSTTGVTKTIETPGGISLMEIIRQAGFDDLLALCGGCCSCATCHVIVDPAWFAKLTPPTEDEEDMLDLAFALESTSRLGCQIVITEKLDGLRVRLPPTGRM